MGRLSKNLWPIAVAVFSIGAAFAPAAALAEPPAAVGSTLSFKAPGGIAYTVDLTQIYAAAKGFGDGEDVVFRITNRSLSHRLALDPAGDAGLLAQSLLSSPKIYPPSAKPDSACSHAIYAPQFLAPRHSETGCLVFPVPVLAKVVGVEWTAGPGQSASWTVEV
jgi:hypothetical protein